MSNQSKVFLLRRKSRKEQQKHEITFGLVPPKTVASTNIGKLHRFSDFFDKMFSKARQVKVTSNREDIV